uniref:Uncharacterized protein LOC113798393 n=1 Tax=Dermatophagoides pteronyssinus TaxID=6956 RepID=A0A6P6YHH2_DERPT
MKKSFGLNFSHTTFILIMLMMQNIDHWSSPSPSSTANVMAQPLDNIDNRFNDIDDNGGDIVQSRIKTKTKTKTTNDKCEIEIITSGNCLVNNNPVKPKIILHLKNRPSSLQSPMEKMQQKIEEEQRKQQQQNHQSSDEYKQQILFEFSLQLIKHMKYEFGNQLKPLIIDQIQTIQLRNYGVGDIYDLKIYGLDEIVPIKESIQMLNSLESSIWTFNQTFYVMNITANFQADINMDEKFFIKQWNLAVQIEQCKFHSQFVLDFNQQRLFTNSLRIKSFENFRLISESLTWPFNEIVSMIVRKEKHFIRQIIEEYSEKYLNMTLNNTVDMNSILEKIFNNN